MRVAVPTSLPNLKPPVVARLRSDAEAARGQTLSAWRGLKRLSCKNEKMAGRFMVAGTFRLIGRGVVAYGDVVSGDVRSGEGLRIPLNSDTVVSARIESVEALDRPDRSYVGLLLQADDELEANILEALGFEGEELDVSPRPDQSTFVEAADDLRRLLRSLGRSEDLVWVPPAHVIAFPSRVYVFTPGSRIESEKSAQSAFESAAAIAVAVRVGAIASVTTKTFAAVWPIYELGDGEDMFIARGVKIDAPHENPQVTIVSSRARWWLIQRRYRRWLKRRDAMLGTAER